MREIQKWISKIKIKNCYWLLPAGAGTLAKISDHYNLYYLDTGKIYRYIVFKKLNT